MKNIHEANMKRMLLLTPSLCFSFDRLSDVVSGLRPHGLSTHWVSGLCRCTTILVSLHPHSEVLIGLVFLTEDIEI